MTLVLILHELVFEQSGEMLESITFNSRQVQNGSVIDTSNCSSSSAFEEIADFTKNTTRFHLTYIIFAASKVRASHPTKAFRKEIQSSSLTSLADDYIFG